MANTTPAQRAAAAQQLQAQYAQQYNPSNVPPPGPGNYIGPYYQTTDGKWYKAPAEGGGQFVPSPPPPDGSPRSRRLPRRRFNLGPGIPGPTNLPGSGGIQWPGGEGVDLRGDFGRPIVGAPRSGPTMPGPTSGIPPNLGTPTPFADLTKPSSPTTDEKKKEEDKGIDWKTILAGLLGSGADIGSVLSALSQQRAAGRTLETQNAQREDQFALQRAQFSLNAPRNRAGQAAYGDYLANVQDININVPGVAPAEITGGMRPSNLGPNARAAGTELSKQALEKLMAGEELPPLSERPEASWIDDLLNYSSLVATGAGIYDRIRNPNPNPTRTPNPTPLPVAGVTPGTTSPSSAQGTLDAGQSSVFGGNGRAVPNWFQPRR